MEKVISEIYGYFEEASDEKFTVHVSRYPRDAISVIRNYMRDIDKDAIVRIYAVGGDGIAFDCLNGIVGLPNTELALMPYGTGNDFVRAFGKENYHMFQNVAIQASSPAIPTDIINCGSNYALNFCGIGLEGAAVLCKLPMHGLAQKAAAAFKKDIIIRRLTYCVGGLRAMLDKGIVNQEYEIIADGEDMSGRYCTINIANGPYYSVGLSPMPFAEPDDGELEMMAARENNFLKKLVITPQYLLGGYRKFPKQFRHRRVKKVSIRSDSPLIVNLDGEAFFDSDITVEVVPRL
jgi:diacylglycerol kinase family enzyme